MQNRLRSVGGRVYNGEMAVGPDQTSIQGNGQRQPMFDRLWAWMTPRRRNTLFLLIVLVVSLLFSYRLRRVLNPLLFALLIAYVLNPVVSWLAVRLRLPRAASIVALFLVVTAGFTGIVVYSVGGGTRSIEALVEKAAGGWRLGAVDQDPASATSEPMLRPFVGRVYASTEYLRYDGSTPYLDINRTQSFEESFEPVLERAANGELVLSPVARDVGWQRVPGSFDAVGEAVRTRFASIDPDEVDAVVARLKQNTAWLSDVAQSVWEWVATEFFGSLATVLGYVLLVPIYTFFLLNSFGTLKQRVVAYLPAHHKQRIVHIASRIDGACASFFRGRLLICLGKGVLAGLGMWLVGVDFALTIGFAVGVLTFIPFLGPVLGGLLAVVFSYGPEGWLARLVGAAVVLVVAEILETVVNPFVLGAEVGMHPLMVLLAFFVFGELFGLFGVLLAVPLAAILKIMIEEFVLPALRVLATDEGGG